MVTSLSINDLAITIGNILALLPAGMGGTGNLPRKLSGLPARQFPNPQFRIMHSAFETLWHLDLGL